MVIEMEMAEVIMNSARQRIFQYFLVHEKGTVKEMKTEADPIMQKPLNIAVMVSGIDEEYQHDILQGIHEFARNHHINICHFVAFGGMLGNPNHDAGEYNIFNLVNYDKLDGAILLTNTIFYC